MNFVDKVGAGFAGLVDTIVENNRKLAQLNRLEAIIRNETEVINHAYIALGKQYFKMLEGSAEESDMTQICELIKFSEKRLKKAQARYDYIKVYGIPKPAADEIARGEECGCSVQSDETKENPEEESADITIAVADEAPKPAQEEKPAEEKPAKKQKDNPDKKQSDGSEAADK